MLLAVFNITHFWFLTIKARHTSEVTKRINKIKRQAITRKIKPREN